MVKRKTARSYPREIVRQERLLRDRDALKVLREHFRGYETRDGFDLRKIDQLTYSQRRGIRKKFAKVRKLLDHPFVETVKPRTRGEAKALRQFTHERMRNMKHFIVQKPTAESRVELVDEQLQLRTKFPGEAEFTERYFLFPKRARGPTHMLRMLEELLPDMPPGLYRMQTDTYGDTGDIVDRDQLRNELNRVLSAYDRAKYGEHRFLYRITGFRWMSTTLKGAVVEKRATDEARRGQRDFNRKRRAQLEREAKARARRETKT